MGLLEWRGVALEYQQMMAGESWQCHGERSTLLGYQPSRSHLDPMTTPL